MNTYANYYENAAHPYTTRQKVPGRKGAIARLITLGVFALIGLLTSFGTIPQFAEKQGLWPAILEAFAGCGVIFLTGGFFWGLIKWIGIIAPKSFGLAKRFWCGWIPLTFLGVYLKCALWLIIAIAPCSIFALLFSPLFSLTFSLAQMDLNIFSAMGVFFGGGAVVLIMSLVDICKLRQISFVSMVREKLARGK